MIHRVDVHRSLLEGAQETGKVAFQTSTRIERIEQNAEGVTAYDQHGEAYRGVAVIGADGVKSVVRQQYVSDPRVSPATWFTAPWWTKPISPTS